MGGELAILLSDGLGRSIEAPERRALFAGEGEVETAGIAVLEGLEVIGKNLKSNLIGWA